MKDFIEDHWPALLALLIGALLVFFATDFLAGEKHPDVINETIVIDKDTEIRTKTSTDGNGNKSTTHQKNYYIYFRDIDRESVTASRYHRVNVGDSVKFKYWSRSGKWTNINYCGNEVIW